MADSLEVMNLGRSMNDQAGAPGARLDVLLGLRGQQEKGTMEISSMQNSPRPGDTFRIQFYLPLFKECA